MKILKLYIAFSFLFLIVRSGYAVVPEYTESLIGSQVMLGGNFFIEDLYANQPTVTHLHTDNLLMAKFIPEHSYFMSNDIDIFIEVELNVTYYDNTVNTYFETFHLSFKDGAIYKDKDIRRFENIKELNLEILSVEDHNNNTYQEENIMVKAEFYIDRIFDFDFTDIPASLSVTSNQNLIEFNWANVYGAESYEIEWSYIDDYSMNQGQYLLLEDVVFNLRNNSTRIETDQLNYSINNVFGHGYVVWRVRAIGRNSQEPDLNIKGEWTVEDIGSLDDANLIQGEHYLPVIDEFENKFNWQYSVNYAENGLRKESIAYFDGTNRNRQNISKMNTKSYVVVGETHYDHYGRPAVDILPVPSYDFLSNEYHQDLYYKDAFNLGAHGVPFNKNFFDLDFEGDPISPYDHCSDDPTSEMLLDNSGAGNYYSTQNQDINDHAKYIPDGEGFPYVQKEYMPDNTGRIRRSGGVGKHNQLGTGNETLYMYSQPNKIELDRLFGTEIGFNTFYQKEAVIDPNGQISVSYKDARGNVVATSLAGGGSLNLENLPTQPNNPAELKEIFINGNFSSEHNPQNVIYNESDMMFVKYNRKFMVTTAGNHDFFYSMSVDIFDDPCIVEELCMNCVYELEITITDDCGVHYTPGNVPITQTLGHLNPIENCNVANPLEFTLNPVPLTVGLDVGTYQLTKTLRIDRDHYEKSLEEFLKLSNNNCYDLEPETISDEGCNINNLEDCLDALGTVDEFVMTGKGSEEDWHKEVERCKKYFSDENVFTKCDMYMEAMLADVSPGGQYGKYLRGDKDEINVGIHLVSVFNKRNVLYGEDSHWKNPRYFTPWGTEANHYFDEKNRLSRVVLTMNKDSSFNMDAETVYYDTSRALHFTYPQMLKNIEDFLKVWEPSWAKSLVVYHPEYCSYQWCKVNDKIEIGGYSSNQFDYILMNTTTYDDAVNSGFITSGVPDLVSQDPYFQYGAGINQLSMIENEIDNYFENGGVTLSLDEYAAYLNKCANDFNNPNFTNCTNFGNTIEFQDTDWEVYRALYLSIKEELQYIRFKSITYGDEKLEGFECDVYTGCVGNEDFDPFEFHYNDRYNFSFQLFSLLDYTAEAVLSDEYIGPCSYSTYKLYRNKDVRIPIATSNFNSQVDLELTKHDLFTMHGRCPNEVKLEAFLIGLAHNNGLNAHNNLPQTSGYSKLIFDIFWDIANTGKEYTLFSSEPDPDLSNDQKQVIDIYYINDYDEKEKFCNITLDLDDQEGSINWNNVTNIYNLKQAESGHPNDFTAYFIVVTPDPQTPVIDTHLVKGNGCFIVGNCDNNFNDLEQCKEKPWVDDILLLMNAIAGDVNNVGHHLKTSQISLIQDYYPFYTYELNKKLSVEYEGYGSYSHELHWLYNSNNDAIEIIKQQSSTDKKLEMLIHNIDLPATDITDFKVFTGIKMHPDIPLHYIITGVVEDGNENVTAELEVSFRYYIFNNFREVDAFYCEQVLPFNCRDNNYVNKLDVRNLLHQLSFDVFQSKVYLENLPAFNSNLNAYFGAGKLYAQVEPITDHHAQHGNAHKVRIQIYREVLDDDDIRQCSFTITGAQAFQYSLSNFAGVLRTFVTEPNRIDLESYTFEMYALNNDSEDCNNDLIKMTITSDCIPFDDCDCLGGFDLPGGCCETLYDDYVIGVEEFNTFLLEPCNCYEYCLCDEGDCDVSQKCKDFGDEYCDCPSANYQECTDQECELFCECWELNGGPYSCELCNCYEAYTCNCCEYEACDEYYNCLNSGSSIEYCEQQFPWCEGCPYGNYSGNALTITPINKEYFYDIGGCNCTESYLKFLEELSECACLGLDDPLECPCDPRSSNEEEFPTIEDFAEFNCDPLNGSAVSYDINSGMIYQKHSGLRRKKEFNFTDPNGCGPFQLVLHEYPEIVPVNYCYEQMAGIAELNDALALANQRRALEGYFYEKYTDHCLNPLEELTVEYEDMEFHTTLYYYDQAGNLVKTVPPEGVNPLEPVDANMVYGYRLFGVRGPLPQHNMVTTYKYNSLNQLTRQSVPDHDKIGKFSINLASQVPTDIDINAVGLLSSSEARSAVKNTGGHSFVMNSSDGGISWNDDFKVELPLLFKLGENAAAGTIFTVGENGTLLKYDNMHEKWNYRTAALQSLDHIYTIHFNGSDGILGSENGTTFVSTNQGDTWSEMALPDPINVSLAGALGNNKAFAIGSDQNYNASIYFSNNMGQNWSNNLSVKTNINLHSVFVAGSIANPVYFAGGEHGGFFTSDDQGQTWKQTNTPFTYRIEKLYFSSASDGLALLSNGQIWSTNDMGISWQQRSVVGEYTNLHVYNSSNGILVGNDGLTATIDLNDFSIWHIDSSGLNQNNLITVDFYDNNTGIVSDENGNLFLYDPPEPYHAGKHSWTQIQHLPIGSTPVSLYLSDNLTEAVLIASNGELFALEGIDLNSDPPEVNIISNITPANTVYHDMFATSNRVYLISYNSSQDEYIVEYVDHLNITDIGFYNQTLALPGNQGTPVISVLDDEHISIATVNSELIISTDNGASWSNYSDNFLPQKLNAFYIENGTSSGYFAGNRGTVVHLDNQTEEFKILSTPEYRNLNDIVKTSNRIIAVGNEGALLISNDGLIWNADSLFDLRDLISLGRVMSGANEYLFVGGENGLLLMSEDEGETWSILDVPASLNYERIIDMSKFKQDKLLLLSENNLIYEFDVVVNKWTRIDNFSFPELRDLHFANNRTGYAVGKDGVLLNTVDGGASWKLLNDVTGFEDIHAVHFTSPLTGFIAADNNGFFRTNDGGQSWTNLQIGVSSVLDIHFYDPDKGVVTGADGNIFETSTGGVTANDWNNVSPGGSNDLYAAYRINNILIAAGENGIILKSDNAGLNWTSEVFDVNRNLYDIHFNNSLSGYISGSEGLLIRTSDGGINWTDISEPTVQSDLNALFFPDDKNGIVAGNNSSVLFVHDDEDLYSTYFWFDKLGRMVISQNAKQYNHVPPSYSYTLYDALGRVEEVGSIHNVSMVPDELYTNGQLNDLMFQNWIASGQRREVTRTSYDLPVVTIPGFDQQNLRNRVSTVSYEAVRTEQKETFDFASHYDYDIHGNVKKLIQDFPDLKSVGNRYKTFEYDYDLISGNVNRVTYQHGEPDQFIHRYNYDADNRIVSVKTSRDGFLWDEDANYLYYRHGPLARTELGEHLVQGKDYAYTIQGWIKGVNSNTLDPGRDMGLDGYTGNPGNPHKTFARDAFGYSLGYFDEDYKPIDNNASFLADMSGSDLEAARFNLYNGNISSMVTTFNDPTTFEPQPQGTAYTYDALNRLAQMKAFENIDIPNNTWLADGSTSDPTPYQTNYTYDANGNILTLKRHGDNPANLLMDDLTYHYDWLDPNDHSKGKRSNRLYHVNDAVSASGYDNDIEDQGPFTPDQGTINTANNYGYDELGNLIRDEAEEIEEIRWNLAGKVTHVIRTGSSLKPDLEFRYDASGHRVLKIVKPEPDPGTHKYTWYSRDAQGNVMATYKRDAMYQYGDPSYSYESINYYLILNGPGGIDQFVDFTNSYFYEFFEIETLVQLINDVDFLEDILRHFSVAQLVSHNTLYGNTIINAYNYNLLVESLVNTDPDYITSLLLTHDAHNFVEAFLDHNAYAFFYAGEQEVPGFISMLYGDYVAGSATTEAQMVDELTSIYPNDELSSFIITDFGINVVEDIIINFIPASEIQAVLTQQYSSAQLINIIETHGDIAHVILLLEMWDAETLMDVWLTEVLHEDILELIETHYPNELLNVIAAYFPEVLGVLLTDHEFDQETYLTYIEEEYGRNMYQTLNGMLSDDGIQIPETTKFVLTLQDHVLYGSSRLGTHAREIPLATIEYEDGAYDINGQFHYKSIVSEDYALLDEKVMDRTLSYKRYELTNHLGNVLAVVSDRKIAVEDGGNPGTVEYYEADVVSAQDYYPFGMIQPGRSVSAGEYRYGFNSMEQDDEWSVTGGHLDFGARIFDARLGRWLAVDPKAAKYPAYSPYNFSINSPVAFNDPDGEDAVFVVFPEYNISTPLGQVSGLGHAGVLLIDNETGETVYYEFGRYDDENIGQVRKISTPDVVFDDHGLPTEKSLTNVFSQLSSEAGKGGAIEGAYFQSDAFQEMYDYAEAQYKQSNPEYDEYDPQRESYNLLRNQCGTFCLDVISQDDEIDRPWFINTSPINIGNYLQRSNISISYDPNERNTTIDAENRDTTIDLDD